MPPAAIKALKLAIRLSAGLLGILVLSIAILIWRLANSPIELDYVTSKIQQVAADLPGGFAIKLKSIGLFWDRDDRMIDLRAVDVILIDSSGSRIMSSPEVDISLSVPALINGVVALSSFELKDARMHLVRNSDGSLQLINKQGTGQPEQPPDSTGGRARDLTAIVSQSFKALESKPDPQLPLSYLDKIEIRGALVVEDRKTGFDFSADDIVFVFSSHENGLAGHLSITVTGPEALDGVKIDVALTARGSEIDAKLQLAGLRPAGLAELDWGLDDLAGVDMTLGGTISTALTLPDTVHKLKLDISGGAGQLSHETFHPRPVKISSLAMLVSADLPGKSLQLSKLDIALGGAGPVSPRLQLSGNAQFGEDSLSLAIKALLQALPVEDLELYWPEGVVNAAREWLVNNLKAGALDKASLNLAMVLPTGPGGAFKLQELNGTLDYSKMTASYFGSMPPATGVTGSGTYDRHGFDLDIDDGEVNGVKVKSGRVVISGMDQQKLALAVDARLAGELAAVYAVLESPPFEIHRVTGVGSDQLDGRIESDFNISLPLKSGLGKEEIHYRADGKLIGGEVRKLYRDFGVRAANLDISVNQTVRKFDGSLELAGIPLTLDWTNHLAEAGLSEIDIVVRVPEITADQIDKLGYETGQYLQGSLALYGEAELGPGGAIKANITSDLDKTQLAIPQIYWNKAPGDPATASAAVEVVRDHVVKVNDIEVDLGTLTGRGKAELDLSNSQELVELEFLAIGKTRLEGIRLTQNTEDGLQLTVRGGELDLEPFLDGANDRNIRQTEKQEPDLQPASTDPASKEIRFELESSDLDKVHLGSDRYFENIRLAARRDRQGWQEANLFGHNPFTRDHGTQVDQSGEKRSLKSGQFNFTFGPSASGLYPLHLEAENLGSLLSTVMGKEDMAGGYFLLSGNSAGALLNAPVNTTFALDNFTLVGAPVLTQVLSLASLDQLIASLKQEGLAFSSFSGDLALNGMRLSSKQMRAHGGSMGLTAGGWADLQERSMEFNGAVIPLYKISNVVGKIPLLGKMVVGDDGEGIAAMDFTLKGGFDQPEVSVKPGSLLTPNALKNIFKAGEEVVDQDSQ